jgi:SAM-dependent methyltransferase
MAVETLVAPSSVNQFEAIYIDAQGDASRVPWADQRPCPALVNWLNAVAPSLIRSGARVVCVGCGLGDDARELMRRGYDVTAFDCSRTAVDWAKRIDPINARCYQQADLFNAPLKWKRRFDLVVEINTIQSLPPEMHHATFGAIAELMSPHGRMLVICRGADEPVHVEDGPPWALTRDELLDAASHAGLAPEGELASFVDDEDPPVLRMRGLFRRA